LALNLLTLVETHGLVCSHCLVHGIAVLVSAEKKIDVMASGPPNRRPLTVKYLDRQEAEEVISCFVLLRDQRINLSFWLSNIFPRLSFISLNQAFDSSEQLKSLGPRCSSLANLFSPVF
jgi:hypothetical protein